MFNRSVYISMTMFILVLLGTAGKSYAAAPVISGVSFSPGIGTTLKIGDTLTATITADAVGYTAGAITINGKAATNFTDIGGNKYTVTYTVALNDTDRVGVTIPVSVVLDNAGATNAPYVTSPLVGATPNVDAHAPVISSVTFTTTTGILRIGATMTAIITADAATYTAGTITINGRAITGFTNNANNTYTVTYTVTKGDPDIAQGSPIPLSVVLTDAAGNSNVAYTTAPIAANAPAVDAHSDTIASVGTLAPAGPTGFATDSFGNLYFADTGSNQVVMADATGAILFTIGTGVAGFTPTAGFTGLSTTLANLTIQFNSPTGVAVDALGNVYIADTGNHRIHKIVADTTTKLITGTSAIATVAGNGIARYFGDDGLATVASLKSPTGLAVDTAGNIYIADNANYRIRKVEKSSGKITTFAGDGNAATLAPYSMALAPAGDLYIADSGNNRILKIAATKGLLDGKTSPITVAGTGTAGYSGDGGLATVALLNQPSGVATDGTDLYISDTMNNCIRKVVLATGVITTRAGTLIQKAAVIAALSNPVGIALDAAGNLYVSDSGNDLVQEIYAGISAITGAKPPGGIYTTAQSVTLTASRAARIYYTTDGSTPVVPVFPAAPVAPTFIYSTPIPIIALTTLKFTSIDLAGHQEVTNTATYTFDSTAPITTAAVINATPVNGTTYYSAQLALIVTLTSSDAPSVILPTIYYTTTGAAPTTASAKYSDPISIPVTSTLTTTDVQFFAMDAVGNKEIVQSKKYSVVAINTTASPLGGSYTTSKTVTLASNDSTAAIYYTTDGTDPVFPVAGTTAVYAAPFVLAANTTLKFRAKDKNANLEQIKSQIYTIDSTAPTTTASPAGSAIPYNTPQTVTLTSDDQNATIYYTTTGTAPTTASSKYTVPIPIPANKTTTLMYFAVDQFGNKETLKTQVYTIDSIEPKTTASVLTGTYAYTQSVTLTADDPKATIYFTTDGTTPTIIAAAKYTIPILINKTTILKYFAVDLAGNIESVKEQDYTLITLTTTASPVGGTFTTAQTVSLAANGVGAKIYYTIDGTTPTKTSKTYTAPLMMTNPTTTLQFFQMDSAGIIESVKSEIYIVDSAAPTSVGLAECGSVPAVVAPLVPVPAYDTIKLKTTDFAKIKYITNTVTTLTKNGAAVTVPAYSLTDYSGPIAFSKNTIVKFFAVDAAGNTEPINTFYCPVVVGVPADANPSLYVDTLPPGATTSSSNLYVNGNVAPFATAFLTAPLNVTTNPTDGSFSYKSALAVGPNPITTTASVGGNTTTDLRIITKAGAVTPATLTIGTANGVVGHDVRVPITFTSGFQAAALSIDIAYDPSTSHLSNPRVHVSNIAAASGKSISGGSPATGVYRILIVDNTGTTAIKAIPDGVVAYLSFSMLNSAVLGNEALAVNSYSVTDLGATVMAVSAAVNGAVNVVSKPGNTGPADTAVTLKNVQDALNMVLDPIVYPVDSSVDLNADGTVQINELQQVVNSFLGL